MLFAHRQIVARLGLAAAIPCAAAFVPLGAQQDSRPAPAYGSTLTFGTGLINIPTAWVSPTSGDLFAALSARATGEGTLQPKSSGSVWDLTESLEAHVGGRFSLGISLFSTKNQEVGAFGQALLLRQPSEGPRWIPSLAIGVRNLGSSAYQDRYVTGDRRVVDVLPDSGRSAGLGKINGNPTLYGVATREFLFERNTASFSIGYGNGLFKNDGGLDTIYNKHGTLVHGLFLGGRLVVPTGAASQLSFMLENDGWDWNVGAVLTFGHLSAGLYILELEEEKGIPDNKPLANFTKAALSFSYNASIPGIVRGSRERAEAAESQLRARRLQQEIAQRQIRSAALERALADAQRSADKAAASRRAELERQLEAEREAMRRAAERLQKLQKGGGPMVPSTPEGVR